jgi:hypothetical protein
MKALRYLITYAIIIVFSINCNKKSGDIVLPVAPDPFKLTALTTEGIKNSDAYYNITSPVVKFTFSAPVSQASSNNSFFLNESSGGAIAFNLSYENNDSTVLLQPTAPLKPSTIFSVGVTPALLSQKGGKLISAKTIKLVTAIDSADKFPQVSDDALMDIIQRQTFKYFWDFGHPTSGLARERNTLGDMVTSGGSGFGIMAIVTAINRQFITRTEGLTRLQKITGFLKNKAQRFHGAFPHWLDGNTGKVIPFSAKDNGADLVETSYLMQGLLTARQYFDGTDIEETALRNDINTLWNDVEWDWFRKNDENVLYWHWSPDYAWDMNQQVKGWNEALITYVLAASSPAHSIPKSVYDDGWASNGGMKNGSSYYGVQLPLGPANGGPLFFAHYSFLGINPIGLIDAYANYETQNKAHSLINYNYCKLNPKNFYGYSDQCWGLTASDDNKSGYLAHEPNNDDGVISPTAALSSMPYTPAESMKALKFFYYKLGDKIFKEYGFTDAFSLHDAWFADSFLAIDQGPIIVMIENHRSGLLWRLFMSCPEVKTGMRNLGFTSPNL